ncbi:PREDICTED: cytochrome b5-like [Papilio xuthus]|uniref:Cytochrome b5 n=1 Tax=Papilio xuthus TaxID=66420 RepID=A0A194PMN0_PAPXU|nr:PREDICTED: cytochrome b5-like [Papilio xuthus]KPI94686.1 Cytochrome b5 [Papilio xuthus]
MATVQAPPELNLPSPLPVAQNSSEFDFMALTMTALRLVNPWAVEAKTQWQTRIEPGTPEAKDRILTLAEVSQHDTPRDCWVVIYDRVYDITTFLDEHPGGADIMLEYAGGDASTAFRSSGHSKSAGKALERFVVGELPIHERMYRRPGGMRLSDIPE